MSTGIRMDGILRGAKSPLLANHTLLLTHSVFPSTGPAPGSPSIQGFYAALAQGVAGEDCPVEHAPPQFFSVFPFVVESSNHLSPGLSSRI